MVRQGMKKNHNMLISSPAALTYGQRFKQFDWQKKQDVQVQNSEKHL